MNKPIKILFLLIGAFLFTHLVVAQKASNKPSVIGPNGFKISSFSGNLFYKRQDLFIESVGPDLDVLFTYNHNKSDLDKGYGFGWTFSYNMYYEIDEEEVFAVRWADGSQTKYIKRNDGDYVGEKGVFDDLTKIDATNYQLKSKDGTNYYFENGSHKRVTKIEDRCGNTLQLTYSDTLLTAITDATNRTIELEWAGGHVVQVRHNLLEQPIVFNYEYDQEGNMIRVTDPMDYSIAYTYDDQHQMIQMVDQNKTPTNIGYQKSGGVKSLISCDFSYSFTYNQAVRRTYVVEQVNDERLITTYQFDEENRIVEKIGNCCGYNQKYTYDKNNNISKRVDGNDNEKLYVYDDKGNPLYITDEEGGQEAFTYEKFYNYVSGRTDKMGNKTTYEYDTKGNLLKVNKPLGVTESFTYEEKNGNIRSSIDANGNRTTYEYDEYGYLNKITASYNITNKVRYDGVGNKIAETNGNGGVTSYLYDAMNRLVQVTDPLGHTRKMIYDGKGNVLEMIDAKGNTAIKVYDGLDRVTSSTSRGGITINYEYDTRGNKIAYEDPFGNRTTYTYNFRNQLLSETNELGHTKTFTYDAAGRKIGETDALGNTKAFKYNDLGRLVKETDPLGNTISYEYDENYRLLSSTNAKGNTAHISYDELGRATERIDPLGNKTLSEFDNNGNAIKIIDAEGIELNFVYDSLNRVTQQLGSLDRTIIYKYDNNNNVILEINANGDSTRFEYDVNDQITKETNPLGEVTSYEYDALGKRIKVHLPNGNVIERLYSADGKLLLEKDKVGILQETTCNEMGLPYKVTNPQGVTTTFKFDKAWRIVEILYADNKKRLLQYDGNNNIISSTNTEGAVKKFKFDALNRVIETQNELGHITKHEYDELGRQIKVVDPKGNINRTEYDPLNRITKIIHPEGRKQEYKYNSVGNIIERKETNNSITKFKYDDAHRLKERIYPNGEIYDYKYDKAGKTIAANTPKVTLSFEFDKSDRLIKEIVNGTEEVNYDYKTADRQLDITYPGGRVVKHQLDYRARAAETKESNNLVASFTYQNQLLDQINYGNGLNTNYQFDAKGRVKSIVTDPGKIFDVSYTYDGENNKLFELHGAHAQFSKKFTYDAINRLTEYQQGVVTFGAIDTPSREIIFEYDELNNRNLQKINEDVVTYQTNTSNQYTSIRSSEKDVFPNYSANGAISEIDGEKYQYDYDNLLIKVNEDINYTYDALSRRFEKKVGSKVTRYYYHHSRVIEERDGQNNTTASHIYAGASDYLIKTIKEDNSYYYHYNSIGSVIGITDGQKNVIEQYDYDPYGKVMIYDEQLNVLSQSIVGNQFFYIGQILDEETGLYYLKARYYNPQLGRFQKRDPIGYSDGLNLYQYANANPINYSDPSGLACVSDSFSISWGKGGLFSTLKKILTQMGDNKIDFSIDLYFSNKTCDACCEEKATMGQSVEVEMGVDFGLQAEVNAIPPVFTKAISFARKWLNIEIEIFLGIEVTGSGGGSSYSKTDECGNEESYGCFNLFASVGIKLNFNFLGALNAGARGAIFVDFKLCTQSCNLKSCTLVVTDFEIGGEAKIYFTIDLSVGWFSMKPIGKEKTWRGSENIPLKGKSVTFGLKK